MKRASQDLIDPYFLVKTKDVAKSHNMGILNPKYVHK